MALTEHQKRNSFSSWPDKLSIRNGGAQEALALYKPFARKTRGYFDTSPAPEAGFNQNQVRVAADILGRISRGAEGWWGHVTGAMDSGKSAVLVRVGEALAEKGRPVAALCHNEDLKRTKKPMILTHGSRKRIIAQGYSNVFTIRKIVGAMEPGTVLLVDEIQFAEGVTISTMTSLLSTLKQRQVFVITAGLDMTFTRMPWENTVPVFSAVEELFVLAARCKGNGNHCALPGVYSQRLVDGFPARRSDPIILVGKAQDYYATCPIHHKIRD